MRRLMFLLVLLTAPAFAVDFGKPFDGTPGYWSSQSGELKFTPSQHDGGSRYSILRLSLRKPESNHPYYVISGEVRHFNVGTPVERVPVFFGTSDALPQLAALSNASGEFSFRIYPADAKSPPSGAIRLPKRAPFFVYFDGAIDEPKKSHLSARVAPSPRTHALSENTLTRRYNIDSLFKK